MNYGGLFDISSIEKKIEELEREVNDVNFWNREDSSTIINELNSLKDKTTNLKQLKKEIEDNYEITKILIEDSDLELSKQLEDNISIIEKKLETMK